MRIALVSVLLVLLPACSQESALSPETRALSCPTGGAHDVSVTATGLGTWNGLSVHTAIFGGETPAVALPGGTVTSGAFAFACPAATSVDVGWVTLYVDVDRDGACGPGDVGTFALFDSETSTSVALPDTNLDYDWAAPGRLEQSYLPRDFCSSFPTGD